MILAAILVAPAMVAVLWIQAWKRRKDATLQHWIGEERREQDAILRERVR